MPQFSSSRGANEWKKLVDDLLLSAKGGGNQTTSIEGLKERFGKIEVGISVAPSAIVGPQFKELAKRLEKKLSMLDGNSPDSLASRKSLRDELKSLERTLLRSALQSQTSVGRQLVRHMAQKDKEAAARFKLATRENAKMLEKQLAKQLLEVTEQRGNSPESKELAALHGDLTAALKALRLEDYKHYQELSKNLANVGKNYGVSDETSEKLDSIEDMVREQSERKERRSEKVHGAIEKATDFVGLGGLYRGGRKAARGVSKAYSAARSAKNFAQRTAMSAGRKVIRSVSTVSSKLNRGAEGSGQDQEESSLIRRQVKALEGILQFSRKKSGGSGGMFDGLSKIIGSAGRFSLAGAAGLLGKLGPLAAAAWAGWSVGSIIYEKYAPQIQDGIEVVVGVIQKGIEFASAGMQWFTDFLANPADRIKAIGGKLKDIWDKSVFAKFFSNPGKVMTEGVSSLMQTISGAGAATNQYVSKAKAKASVMLKGISSRSTAALSDAGSAVVSAAATGVAAARGAVESGYRSITDAAGKLFKAKPGVDLENLHPSVQSNFLSMSADYKAKGGKGTIMVNSGARSSEEQARLYAINPSKAAPPGRSSHERGLAIDINSKEANELDAMGLLSKYGFSRPVKGEAWHLQAAGTATSLASAGIYSADNPSDQSANSVVTRRRSETAVPVAESVPPAPTVTSQPQVAQGSEGGDPPMSASGPTSKGSVASIPTFSYLDSGMFMMNAGVLA